MNDLVYKQYRLNDNRESTISVLIDATNNYLQCFILEDQKNAVKVAGETRIDGGLRYEIKQNKTLTPLTEKYRKKYSWFEWHLELQNVPRHSHIYQHTGNKDDHTDGCHILSNEMRNNRVYEGFNADSTSAFKEYYLKTCAHLNAGGRVFIDVYNERVLRKMEGLKLATPKDK